MVVIRVCTPHLVGRVGLWVSVWVPRRGGGRTEKEPGAVPKNTQGKETIHRIKRGFVKQGAQLTERMGMIYANHHSWSIFLSKKSFTGGPMSGENKKTSFSVGKRYVETFHT